MGRHSTRAALAVALAAAALYAATRPADASNVAAGLGEGRTLTVPTWLSVLTGAAAVGASGLLAALVTDRAFVDALHGRSRPVATWLPRGPVRRFAGGLGVAGLAAVVLVGLDGPRTPTANLAVLLAFVGLRSVLPMVAFLVANPWPAVDPFRTLAGALSRAAGADGVVAYPERLRSWPAVVGLAALLLLELLAPVTTDPRALATATLGYAAVTVACAFAFSPRIWFRRGDPLAVLFRLYGAVAPLRRDGDGLRLSLPGSRLREGGVVADASEVAFVVLVVWELTFNGFVVTPPGARTIEGLVAAGVPPRAGYLLVFLAGFALFLGLYRLAAVLSRRTAPTFLAAPALARLFAPPLLAVAAGYHLAHYVAFAVSLAPATLAALANPLSPPVNPTVLAAPGWVGGLETAFVLAGHLLAVWVAHAVALDRFPGRLQAIRSQYPFVAVMVCYTAASLWLLSLPTAAPPYVGG
ncbi:hypothetical protein [Salinilacihabitans rarus]|uniref:hypothetical protein n=1 Tax=Salinilacihabitans rarus TaxID=2961596 RepID=UPI0020C8A4DB|nr:hypothetical protein [Salinilacihabitans rarus]